MGHNYENHFRAHQYAKASNVDITFDDGIEGLQKWKKIKNLMRKSMTTNKRYIQLLALTQ